MIVGEKTLEGLTNGLTRTESIALVALMEHIGLTLTEPIEATPTRRTGARTWTRAQKAAHSRKMKAYWRTRRGK